MSTDQHLGMVYNIFFKINYHIVLEESTLIILEVTSTKTAAAYTQQTERQQS